MGSRHMRRIGLAVALTLVCAPETVLAQGGLLGRVKRRVEDNIGRQAERAVDCAMGDQSCISKAKAEGRAVKIDSSQAPGSAAGGAGAGAGTGTAGSTSGATGQTATAGAGPMAPPLIGEGALVNYDYKPGDRVLFAEDFTRDNIGDFPRKLEFAEGSFEVVDWRGQRLLRAAAKGRFMIPLPEALPERFTVEIDIVPSADYYHDVYLTLGETDESSSWHVGNATTNLVLRRDGTAKRKIVLEASGAGVRGVGGARALYDEGATMVPLRIMVDGRYLKAYLGGERVINVPNATLPRGKSLTLSLYADADNPAHIGGIRVMAGGRALYDAIAEKGRASTQGVLFATGSDEIRVESKPTLDEIGAMLTEHPTLRLMIEGHTDNVGAEAANLDLSRRRAAAVKKYLVERLTVDAARLQTSGFGSTKPVQPNTTPEGRQTNRRVELVKLP